MPWPTVDPFLFCVYHNDAYPAGKANFAPAASLAGRDIGQDFSGKDGFSMYHGRTVPGFPQHPHRGFETVTVVRKGRIDHADSLGAKARFGDGDAQWLTAGKGIVHSEMFPLLKSNEANPLELFQIWLNLPAKSKMAEPYFDMLWNENIPKHESTDTHGRTTKLAIIAGAFTDAAVSLTPQTPPPQSWANAGANDVAIWTLKLAANAEFALPAAVHAKSRRMLYFFAGDHIRVGDATVGAHCAMEVRAHDVLTLVAGNSECELLMLQGVPIAEPVAAHGPFVMNTRNEIMQAMQDYQRTQFGGWPHNDEGPVHGADPARFATRPDGTREVP
jgi:quercetin 2,3-dioxygenase